MDQIQLKIERVLDHIKPRKKTRLTRPKKTLIFPLTLTLIAVIILFFQIVTVKIVYTAANPATYYKVKQVQYIDGKLLPAGYLEPAEEYHMVGCAHFKSKPVPATPIDTSKI